MNVTTMRRALGALLVLAAFGTNAASQDSVQKTVQLPSGATMSRTCASWSAEGVFVIAADRRGAGHDAKAYFPQLATAIERRMPFVTRDTTVHTASFAAELLHSGAVVKAQLVHSSGRAGFDLAARQALAIDSSSTDLVPTPASLPDSLGILIMFGRKSDGSRYVVTHLRCPATPFPDNPKPDYPMAETIIRSDYPVLTRYLVDTTGLVDSTSIEIEEHAADAFAQATIDYLRKIQFLPEEFDGVKERQHFERTILFVAPKPPQAVADSTN